MTDFRASLGNTFLKVPEGTVRPRLVDAISMVLYHLENLESDIVSGFGAGVVVF